ncbi:unnamed protein product [Amaranthus hypochondriacus]
MWETIIVNLLIKYYKEARHAVYMNNTEDKARTNKDEKRMEESFAKPPSFKNMDLKSKTRVGGRCCICFDPFSIQNVSVVIFFCCHAYHMTCYMDSVKTYSDENEAQNGSLDSEYDEFA